MANLCYFRLKVSGLRQNVKSFSDWLNSEDGNHRVYWADKIEEHEVVDELASITFEGDCAWSLHTALGQACLKSEQLNLVIEGYSSEYGFAFQEHYLWALGKVILEECIDWNCYYYDRDEFKDFGEFLKKHDLLDSYTEDDLNDNGDLEIGGYDYWNFENHKSYFKKEKA